MGGSDDLSGATGARLSAGECSEAILRVYEFIDGEMSAEDCAKIQSHLDTCEQCLAQYHRDQMLKALVKRSCGGERAPIALRTTIMQRLTTVRIDYTE